MNCPFHNNEALNTDKPIPCPYLFLGGCIAKEFSSDTWCIAKLNQAIEWDELKKIRLQPGDKPGEGDKEETTPTGTDRLKYIYNQRDFSALIMPTRETHCDIPLEPIRDPIQRTINRPPNAPTDRDVKSIKRTYIEAKETGKDIQTHLKQTQMIMEGGKMLLKGSDGVRTTAGDEVPGRGPGESDQYQCTCDTPVLTPLTGRCMVCGRLRYRFVW